MAVDIEVKNGGFDAFNRDLYFRVPSPGDLKIHDDLIPCCHLVIALDTSYPGRNVAQ